MKIVSKTIASFIVITTLMNCAVHKNTKAGAPAHASDFKGILEQTDKAYWDGISPIEHVPNVNERALPHFIVRGTKDPIVSNAMVQHYGDVLQKAGQKVEYIQVEGAGHAFFDWKPDATTRATFVQLGVKYADAMRNFFDGVFYKSSSIFVY